MTYRLSSSAEQNLIDRNAPPIARARTRGVEAADGALDTRTMQRANP